MPKKPTPLPKFKTKPAPMKMATAPFQPRTGAYAPDRLSESARVRIAAELASDSTKWTKEVTPKSNEETGKDSPTVNAENDLRQGDSETPQ